ncbi:DNA repair protein rhp7 [Linum grandiflorum]
MVLHDSPEVTSKSNSEDSTPSDDNQESSAAHQLEAPSLVSPSDSGLPITTRWSTLLGSKSPTTDQYTSQTAGRKRKTAAPCIDLNSGGITAEEEGAGNVISDNGEKGCKDLSSDASPSDKRARRWSSEEKRMGKLKEVGDLDEGRWAGNPNPSSTGTKGNFSATEQERVKEMLTQVEAKESTAESAVNQFTAENVKWATDGVPSRTDQFKVAEEEPTPDVEAYLESPKEEQKLEDGLDMLLVSLKVYNAITDKIDLLSAKPTPDKPESVAINRSARDNAGLDCSNTGVPSLRQLCLEGLAQNADAITSLENVPDVYRRTLSKLVCDFRKMNKHFLKLLVRGSPSEIRIRDCSCLTEEEFSDCIEGLDTTNLKVLQLDFCGRSLPDYVLVSSLAGPAVKFPVLTTVSLKSAYRLSDAGLRSLLSATPGLECLNLSQCSLIAATSIGILADSLGSKLKELYLSDCQSIVAMDMLPALVRLQRLEVLSLSGIETVSDTFIMWFCAERGDAMKELVLSDCVKLTDTSLQVIAATCPQLLSLHIANLRNLTDSALGYLAKGCQNIQTLRLGHTKFSDEAIAGFIEASGKALKDVSLNSVRQVSHNTAVAIAGRARDLQSLDISWCRKLEHEAVEMIMDNCLSLKVLKVFGCDQLTDMFMDGHYNPAVEVIGKKMSPGLADVRNRRVDIQAYPTYYTSVLSSM